MTTAMMISQMLELHDDALIADVEQVFNEIDRSVALTPRDEYGPLLLIVDELVDEMLAPPLVEESNKLSISLELELGVGEADASANSVAEVA